MCEMDFLYCYYLILLAFFRAASSYLKAQAAPKIQVAIMLHSLYVVIKSIDWYTQFTSTSGESNKVWALFYLD
jgi:hypothetical protein